MANKRSGSVPIAVFSLLLCGSIPAQIPDAEAIQRDLHSIYATRPASPDMGNLTAEGRSLVPLMVGQGTYLLGELHAWEEDPGALTITDGNHGEHGIRPNAHIAFSCAAMYRTIPAPYPAGYRPEAFRDAAVKLLRFVLPTHNAGSMTCSDGKKWYGQWQSAHWADSAGRAAWLLWDDLDPELKWLAARMVTDEADRFVGKRPPSQIESDTKAEENAWNSAVVALAYSMFPDHPNHEAYRETAIRWALSSFIRQADLEANPTVDGRTLRQWDVGANLHDDHTLENHDRIHPDYMNTITLLLHQIPVYRWGGHEPPEALLFNAPQVYANLKIFSFPDGNHIYPSGQDWRLHRNPDWMEVHLPMGMLEQDPQAMRLFAFSREATERMLARAPELGIYHPGEYFFPSARMHTMERGQVFPYLMNGLLGGGPEPVPEDELWNALSGSHVFLAGKFAVFRTPGSISTFSWGDQVMGMTFPIQRDLLINPFERSMVGSVDRAGLEDEKPVVRRVEVMPRERELALCGILDRAGGALEQRFAFVALPDGRSIYVDSMKSVQGADVPTTLSLGTMSILDDPKWIYHDGDRTVFVDGGEVAISSTSTMKEPIALESDWLNVDDELGVVVLERTGRTVLHPEPLSVRARTFHQLHLNQTALGPGGERTAAVFYPARSAGETRRAADGCSIAAAEDGSRTVTLEDGMRIVVDLGNLQVKFP